MNKKAKYDDDDYVAKLLAEDAKKTSQRYAAVGLSALLPKQSSKTAPKPNTRFLNHLVREVDSHNAALKKKEELEARIRLRELKSGEKHRREDDDDGRGYERKRRRVDGDRDSERHPRHHRLSDRRRSMSPDDKNSRDRMREKSSRSHHTDRYDRERTRRRRSYSPEVLTKDSNRLSPPSESDSDSKRSSRRHRHRHEHRRSPPVSSLPEVAQNSRKPATRSDPQHSTHYRSEDESSDVLSSIIKPKTSKPIPRGRGTSSKSMMDTHFSKTYDPTQDLNVSSDENDDWDMALEALRDRTAWKRKQTERLREAGFGEDEIQRWERSAKDKDGVDRDIKDVRWKSKGEGKEWDEGKIGVT